MKTDLIYEDYKQYEVELNSSRWNNYWSPDNENTYQHRFMFPNGYGASIVKCYISYGYQEDLFELAVITKDGLNYDTPITNDVEGWLTNEEVLEILEKIKNLEKYGLEE